MLFTSVPPRSVYLSFRTHHILIYLRSSPKPCLSFTCVINVLSLLYHQYPDPLLLWLRSLKKQKQKPSFGTYSPLVSTPFLYQTSTELPVSSPVSSFSPTLLPEIHSMGFPPHHLILSDLVKMTTHYPHRRVTASHCPFSIGHLTWPGSCICHSYKNPLLPEHFFHLTSGQFPDFSPTLLVTVFSLLGWFLNVVLTSKYWYVFFSILFLYLLPEEFLLDLCFENLPYTDESQICISHSAFSDKF